MDNLKRILKLLVKVEKEIDSIADKSARQALDEQVCTLKNTVLVLKQKVETNG